MGYRVGIAAMILGTLGSLAACGSDVTLGPPDDSVPDVGYDVGVTAGSRLRPVMAVADGVAAFLIWHDTKLGVDCWFRPVADLSVRCLPITPQVVFLDDQCTKPAFVQNDCFDPYEYGGLSTEPDLDFCERSQQEAYFEMYRRIPGGLPDTTVYRGRRTPDGFQCTGPAELAPDEWLERAEKVPAEAFVAAERVVVPGTGRLGRVEWQAEDGAREVIEALDAQYDAPCSWWPSYGDGQRCIARNLGSVGEFSFVDSSCSEQGARASCGAPIAHKVVGSACGGTGELYELGPPADACYGGADGVCEETATDGAFHLGPKLTSEDFPVVTQAEEGSGRLRARYVADSTGWRLAQDWHRLYDSELGLDCELRGNEAGATGCVPPSGSPEITHYADAACTQPVLLVEASDCPFVWDWVTMREIDDHQCPRPGALREVLGPSTSASFYGLDDQGACAPSPIPEGEIAYELGPPRSLDFFPPVAIETW